MKNILNKIYDFLARPFKENFTFLLIMVLLVCGPRLYYFLSNDYPFDKLIWELCHSYLLCYIAALFSQLFPKRLKKIYVIVFGILALLDFCIELCCILVTKAPFYEDHVAIVMGTNLSEGRDFLNTYITWDFVLVLLSVIVLIVLIVRCRSAIDKLAKYIAVVASFITVFSFIYFELKGTESWGHKFYNKFYSFASYETPPNLLDYQQDLTVKFSADKLPDNIVLILGESFAKSHSSLYGYSKNTNPRLSEIDQTSLIVYDSVSAPAFNTIECIKAIMSTYNHDDGNSPDWYMCETLPNIMSHCGYSTAWISNQSSSGVFDNIATRYSELCDTACFVGNKMKGMGKTDFDEEVLPKLQSFNEGGNNFIIVHLMGSHFKYAMRYPANFNINTKNNYPELKESQRDIIASYDNSIIYNDYVVNEILKYFEYKEALVLYFSDHGQDLFDSSENYFGHAIIGNPKSETAALQIPFLVYMSPSFQEKYPQTSDWIRDKKDEPFNTSNTIDFLCNILNIQYCTLDRESVAPEVRGCSCYLE